jgi:uncharacterized integral membrane protein
MQTLRTIIWSIISAIMAIFAIANWQPVSVSVWPGQTADTQLAVVIFGSFLIGFLPPFLVYMASKWRARKTIQQQAQVISDLRTAPVAVTATELQVIHTPVDADPVTGTVDGNRAL